MKTEPTPLTRREALLNALKGTVAAAVAMPVVVQAAPTLPTSLSEPEFVPENDYPFFGSDVPEGYCAAQTTSAST